MSFYDPRDEYDQPATLEEEGPRRRGSPNGLYNLISAAFMLATAAALVLFVVIFQRSEPLALGQVRPTATLIPFPGLTPQPTETATLAPTEGPTLTPTETLSLPPTATQAAAPAVVTNTPSLFPFTLRDNAITYEENTNDQGCDWLSIAGRVIDLNGDPVDGLPVQVTGDDFEQLVFTGTAPTFGEGGFEVFLNAEPIQAEYRVQLLNTTGQPFSEPIIVRTLDSCERNVAIAIFEQNADFASP